MYLHNNPSPPTGDTASQASLPMNSTAPSGSTLFNYDTNRDSRVGLKIARGGSGCSESSLTLSQRWVSSAFIQTTQVNGAPQLIFWSEFTGAGSSATGVVTACLVATNGSLQAWIVSGTVQASWTKFTHGQKTITFTNPGANIPAGYWLELKLIVPITADDVTYGFAYDTTFAPSRIVWP